MNIASLKDLKNSDSIGQTIKLGAGLIIGLAADVAITALFHRYLPTGNGIVKMLTKLGAFAIGLKVSEDIEEYFYKVCDDTKAAWNEAKEEAQKAVVEVMMEEKDEGGH